MVRRRRLVPVAIACAVGWALAPGAAQAAAARSAVAQAAAAAGPAARPVAALVDDIAPGPASSDPRDLTAMNGELYFTAWTLRHSRQLWKTNGTAGTAMLTHVAGPSGADPQDLTVADGVLFFSARDPGHGRKLWKSNGTAAGTTLVPGRTGSDPRDITYAIGQQEQNPPNQVLVYFSARDPGHGRQLWKSDGTAAGTAMITDVNPRSGGLAPQDIAPVSGPAAMFSGDDGVHGREPWVTDGTTAGTRMYEDLNPGRAGSDPAQITPEQYVAGFVAQFPIWYFSADDGTHGREFFVAYNDDPPAEVYDVNPGPASSDPGPFDSVVLETGLFAATGVTGGRELFDVQQPDPQDITAVGQVAYFTANDPAHGRELWKLTVPLAPQMFLAPLAPVKTGSPVRLTVTMELVPGVPMPTGSVTFFEDGRKIATRPLARQRSGGPTASLTIAARSGTHQIVAVYSGDGRYLPATSNTVPLTGN